MNRYSRRGIFILLTLLVTPAYAQPFLPPKPAPPANRRAFVIPSAQIASFEHDASALIVTRRVSPKLNRLARQMEADASLRLGALGVSHIAPSPRWSGQLDQLRHLPSQYLMTRYSKEMVKALETERELCRTYILSGADASTKFVARRLAS